MGRKRKSDSRETFADVVGEMVAADLEPAEPAVAWRQPVWDGHYTDEFGVRWLLRGGGLLAWKRAKRLIEDPQVRVLHLYLNEICDVLPEHREGFTERIHPYLAGKRFPTDDHTDFRAAEFEDDQHRSLLIVEETC